MRRLWNRQVIDRTGRRGAALLAFAFIDIVVGWSLFDAETQAQTKAIPAYRATLEIAPLPIWGALWLLVGALCAVCAFLVTDRIAYGAAIGVKIVWAGSFLASWVIYNAPRAWLSAATWGVVAALVLVISGWPEPKGGRVPCG
jgi:drug/metabolite transporter (DMT)-like permease